LFVVASFFIALAALTKIPTLYLGLPLLFLAWQRFGKEALMRWELWLFAGVVLIPVGAWYFHAHTIFQSSGLTFSIWAFGSDKWGIAAPLCTVKFYNDIFFKSIAERHLTYAGFIPFVVGLFVTRKRREEYVFDWWLIAVIIFFFIVTVGNQVHEYYQLPFTLPACVFVGKAFDKFLSRASLSELWREKNVATVLMGLCLVGIPILSTLRVANFMRGEDVKSSLFKLAEAVQKHTLPGDLVVAVDEGDPVYLYRANRKGWHGFPGSITRDYLQERAALGAEYLIGDKGAFARTGQDSSLKFLLDRYTHAVNEDDYFILNITVEKK
jgi:hypothetical protein